MGYGIEDKKGFYQEYVGKWVVVYPAGINTQFSGKLVEIIDGYGALKPFQGGKIEKGKLVRKLIGDDGRSLVPLVGSAIEPTTKESIINYCKMFNKKSEESSSK